MTAWCATGKLNATNCFVAPLRLSVNVVARKRRTEAGNQICQQATSEGTYSLRAFSSVPSTPKLNPSPYAAVVAREHTRSKCERRTVKRGHKACGIPQQLLHEHFRCRVLVLRAWNERVQVGQPIRVHDASPEGAKARKHGQSAFVQAEAPVRVVVLKALRDDVATSTRRAF